MSWSVALLLVGQVAVIGLLLAFFFRSRAPEPETPDLTDMVETLRGRQEHLETRWQTILEELNERVESANKAYARARASQVAYRRRKERDEELEEQEEDESDGDIRAQYAAGSNGSGMRPMPPDVGGPAEPAWKEQARAIARMYLEKGIM